MFALKDARLRPQTPVGRRLWNRHAPAAIRRAILEPRAQQTLRLTPDGYWTAVASVLCLSNAPEKKCSTS